jgi:NAD(P)-dependent dehydrogenase (short-subunit alcohol dehydrogenase family)
MPAQGSVVIVGGTRGIGLEVARHYAGLGRDVVVTGRGDATAKETAAGIGSAASGIALELTRPEAISDALSEVGPVDHLVLAAIDRDENTVRDYDIQRATSLAMLKLVGYTEVVHTLVPRLGDESSIVVFGGQAKDRPYGGSLTVTTVNGAMDSLVRALAVELAPVRVNGIHPGIVGDSPYWAAKPEQVLEGIRARTPTGRLVTMEDIVGAVVFLLENSSMNGENLTVNGGTLLL